MQTDIRLIPNAIDPNDCQRLIARLSAHLTPAKVSAPGGRAVQLQDRDAFNYKFHDDLLRDITAGIVGQFEGAAPDHARIEPMEIVCYPPGNGFRRHVDGPHRSHSIVYMLNRGYEGGALVFDSGPVFHDLPVGTAVAWANGPDSIHAGAPLTRGLKWIVASWVRHPAILQPASSSASRT